MRTDDDGAYPPFGDGWPRRRRARAGRIISRRCFPKCVRAGTTRCGRATRSIRVVRGADRLSLRPGVRRASRRARRRCSPRESRALLALAGERGLRDAAIARTARDLFQLALDGARRLGDGTSAQPTSSRRAYYANTPRATDRRRTTSPVRSPRDRYAAARRLMPLRRRTCARMRTVRSRSSRV